jgi:hypothetical protein
MTLCIIDSTIKDGTTANLRRGSSVAEVVAAALTAPVINGHGCPLILPPQSSHEHLERSHRAAQQV